MNWLHDSLSNLVHIDMKIEAICETLGVPEYQVSKYKGVFTYRQGFFYRMGDDASSIRKFVEDQLAKAGVKYNIIDYGEKYAPFRGGSKLKESSHWYVKFTVDD